MSIITNNNNIAVYHKFTRFNEFYSVFAGYFEVAEFVNLGKRRFLLHDYHRYRKDGGMNDVIHWRCVKDQRDKKCKARATTKFINGVEHVRVNAKAHSHCSEPYFFTG